ncbi:hypothetical protein OQX61_21040 [Pedobacter sp. PLR]|uniref:hypothetical protein n=1 Tax=Pedobacter sp. PLR TaxID=2994465 RepID=UPI0022459D7F|nr:hypothetical protein [Pedobacter sp. PLR]MCX2453769.1 hypothetical protein [Pedobacter sp. PLR]
MKHTTILSLKGTLILLILTVVFSFSSLAQNHKKYWPDGKSLKETGELVNGNKQGNWKTYHQNGQLESEINYTKESGKTGNFAKTARYTAQAN